MQLDSPATHRRDGMYGVRAGREEWRPSGASVQQGMKGPFRDSERLSVLIASNGRSPVKLTQKTWGWISGTMSEIWSLLGAGLHIAALSRNHFTSSSALSNCR